MSIESPSPMRGRPLIGAAAAFFALTAASCGAAETPRPELQPVETTSTTHVVEIRQFKFVPQTLTVKKGDVIIWRNLDVVPHTASAEAQQWDSGNLNKDAEWTLVAGVAGETDYICAYHPTMKGTIIVTDN